MQPCCLHHGALPCTWLAPHAACWLPTRLPPACCRADGMCLLVRCALQLAADKGVTLKEWAAAVLAPVEGHQVGT